MVLCKVSWHEFWGPLIVSERVDKVARKYGVYYRVNSIFLNPIADMNDEKTPMGCGISDSTTVFSFTRDK